MDGLVINDFIQNIYIYIALIPKLLLRPAQATACLTRGILLRKWR